MGDWFPLLYFANGNPRVITELVRAALKQDVTNADGVRNFVNRIRESGSLAKNGSVLSDSVSLASSLRYGLREVFTERDRPTLAILHLFRNTVVSSIVGLMGNGRGITTVQQLMGVTEANSRQILEAATDLGLLEGPGGGNYRMHPVLPTLMADLFIDVFGPPGSEGARNATRSFVESVASMGVNLAYEINRGSAERLGNLLFIEGNIVHARSLAEADELGDAHDRCTEALAILYRYLGLRGQWHEKIAEFAEATTDPETGRPREGRVKGWFTAAEHQVKTARDNRDWETAERHEQSILDYSNERVADTLAADPMLLSESQRQEIISHAAHLGTMGQIRREQGYADCLRWFGEALNLQRRMGDVQSQFDSIYNIGESYRKVPRIRNLDTAEAHFLSCLDLIRSDERLKSCKVLGELGYIAWQRYLDGGGDREPVGEGREFLLRSLRYYHAALSIVPTGALQDAATFHNQLGLVYQGLNDYPSAMEHLQQAHRLYQQAGDPLGTGRALSNLAYELLAQDRTEEARPYLVEAIQVLEQFDGRLQLVTHLRQSLAYLDAELKREA
jgi:tetratricopeptide (TPR) repeat protein